MKERKMMYSVKLQNGFTDRREFDFCRWHYPVGNHIILELTVFHFLY